jgi:hypothetical protein
MLVAGCGSSSKSKSATASSEAASAATGDIPDNQNFLTFADRAAGFSIRYPEGWARKTTAAGVRFADKDNTATIAVAKGPAPTTASVTAVTRGLGKATAARQLTLGGKRVIKVTYSRSSPPNPVTGKRLTLMVDHYELAKGGRRAVVELATPVGVDNVDAYRLMIESFKWL